MTVVRNFPLVGRRDRRPAERNAGLRVCPILMGAPPSAPGPGLGWDAVVAEVERRLEAMRQREVQRRLRREAGFNEEARAVVDELTRGVLRHAVIDVLQEAGRRGGMTPGNVRAIWEMFPPR